MTNLIITYYLLVLANFDDVTIDLNNCKGNIGTTIRLNVDKYNVYSNG